MSDYNGEDGVAEGPLFLLFHTAEYGGRSLYAQWNGFTFDLYADPEREEWFGEAETLDDPEELAFHVLSMVGRPIGTL